MTGGSGFLPCCSEMGWWAEFHHSAPQCSQGQAEASAAWVPGQHELHFDAQHTLSEEHMTHRTVNIVVNISSFTIFMGLTILGASVTITSQPLVPLSIMNHSPPQQALIEQAFLGVCSLETVPGQRHTDPSWPPFLYKALYCPRKQNLFCATAVNSDPMTLLTKNILCSGS